MWEETGSIIYNNFIPIVCVIISSAILINCCLLQHNHNNNKNMKNDANSLFNRIYQVIWRMPTQSKSYIFRLVKPKTDPLPGPYNLPFLGYLPFITKKPHFHFTFNMVPKFGNVFSFRFGHRQAVVLNDWESVKEAFVSKGTAFSGRPDLFLFRMLNKGHGLINSEGTYRKHQKKFIMNAVKEVFDDPSFHTFLSNEMKYLCEAIEKIRDSEITKQQNPNPSIDLHKLIQCCFINVVCGVVFGCRYEYDSPVIEKFMNEIDKNFELVGQKGVLLNFFPPFIRDASWVREHFAYQEIFDSIEYLLAFTVRHIKDVLDDSSVETSNRPKNLVQIYANYIKKYENEMILDLELSEKHPLKFDMPKRPLKTIETLIGDGYLQEFTTGEELCTHKKVNETPFEEILPKFPGLEDSSFASFLMRGNKSNGFTGLDMIISLMDMFLGGTETTQTAFRWGLYFMAKHPSIQDNVWAELDSYAKEQMDPNVLKEFTISYANRNALPYTNATIMEIQRRASIAPIGLFHANVSECQDFTKHKYRVPARSYIIANHYAIHHDPKYWPNPYKFQPKRFLKPKNFLIETTKGKGSLKSDEYKNNINNGKEINPIKVNPNLLEKNSEKWDLISDKPSYMPFSIGSRACLGISIAKSEIFYAFVHLFYRYRLTFSDDCKDTLPIFQTTPNINEIYGISTDDNNNQIEDGDMAITWNPPPFKLYLAPRKI